MVSFHRYPMDATKPTLAAAAADPAAFALMVADVRARMQAAGAGAKPLALTETNLVYNNTPPGAGLEASPGTVPHALWMADSIGVALKLQLWTVAIWDVSDPDDWSLGLIGLPPAHTARPAYHAVSLWAAHRGATMLPPAAAPAGVKVHATRNDADDATEVIVINWTAPTSR